jgi:hypothetical protein
MSAVYERQSFILQADNDLTHRILSPAIKFHDISEHGFKDFPQTDEIYQLVVPGLVNDFPLLKTLAHFANKYPLQPTPFIGIAAAVAHRS